jgi:hypothetical protein
LLPPDGEYLFITSRSFSTKLCKKTSTLNENFAPDDDVAGLIVLLDHMRFGHGFVSFHKKQHGNIRITVPRPNVSTDWPNVGEPADTAEEVNDGQTTCRVRVSVTLKISGVHRKKTLKGEVGRAQEIERILRWRYWPAW